LIVATEFPPGPGGVGTHAFELARHLSQRGWDVSVLASQDYVATAEAEEFNAAQPFAMLRWKRLPVGPLGALWRLAALRKAIRQIEPDLIVASGGRAVALTALAARNDRTPWVAIGHGTEFGRRRGAMAALLRRSFDRATAVVCVSEYTRNLMHEAGVRPGRVAVIPNGADPLRFRVLGPEAGRQARCELGLPEGRLLVTVGHVSERKGQDVVVRALPRVLESAPDAHYVAVGLPTTGPALRKLAQSLGVDDHVWLPGRLEPRLLVGLLNAADIFVLTSRRTGTGDVEGFGIAVVEAALCGLPAIVSSGSGLAEAVREGETGLVVPPEDPDETAAAVIALLEDDSLRKSMGLRARARALSEQSWASRVEKYDALLRPLADGKPRSVRRDEAAAPRGRTLLVVSHTAHYAQNGEVRGWGPTVREIDRLASLFDELVHVAPLHPGPAPASALPYEAANVRLVPVRPSGGTTLLSKLGLVSAWLGYARVLRRELGRCDTVHVRCPSNIGLLAIGLLALRRTPRSRWIKYAGNWCPSGGDSLGYALQRWLLRRGAARAIVTVNGSWPEQPAHVRPFMNPCLTEQELREGAAVGTSKDLRLPLRLLFIGRVEEAKGCGRAVEILAGLRSRGVDARLDIVGDGEERPAMASRAAAAGLGDRIQWLGWLPRPALNRLYGEAHILLLPSLSSEGWPKVLSEGMAYGAVPVASTVSSIPQYLEMFGAGRALDPSDRAGYIETIAAYVQQPERWRAESRRAMEAASSFSYDRYLGAVREVLRLEPA
jgi:phosphatidylinositol alpha-1,6-mannosyltransferase